MNCAYPWWGSQLDDLPEVLLRSEDQRVSLLRDLEALHSQAEVVANDIAAAASESSKLSAECALQEGVDGKGPLDESTQALQASQAALRELDANLDAAKSDLSNLSSAVAMCQTCLSQLFSALSPLITQLQNSSMLALPVNNADVPVTTTEVSKMISCVDVCITDLVKRVESVDVLKLRSETAVIMGGSLQCIAPSIPTADDDVTRSEMEAEIARLSRQSQVSSRQSYDDIANATIRSSGSRSLRRKSFASTGRGPFDSRPPTAGSDGLTVVVPSRPMSASTRAKPEHHHRRLNSAHALTGGSP